MPKDQNDCNEEKIEFIIRSAMQTFQDTKVQCLSSWTIIQLKEYLFKTLLIKPEVSRQRLIYAGHCLEDSCTIQSILKKRTDTGLLDTSNTAQVIHLVYSSNEAIKNVISSSLNNKTGLRYRQNATTSSSTSNSNNLNNNLNGVTNVLNATNDSNTNNTTQFFNDSYNHYNAYYQNFYNQFSAMMYYQQNYMMQQQFSLMNNLPAFYGLNNNMIGGGTTPTATTQPQIPQNNLPQIPQNNLPQPFFFNAAAAAVPIDAFPAGGLGMQFNPIINNPANPLLYATVNNNINNNNIINNNQNLSNAAYVLNPAVVGAAAREGVNGVAPQLVNNDNRDNAANRLDILDIIYKAVRYSLLMMVLYLYSSFERFFVVLLSIFLIWLVQRRREQQRNRNNRNVQQQNLENEEGAAAQSRNNDLSNENSVQSPPTISTDNQISSWTVFWTTVSSFFTSLIPENPRPINAN